jgi:pimeloyl-ACP methyl ester carboxylesterase
VTILVADPAIYKLFPVEYLHPYPHVRPVIVPGAGHWIQYEFPDVIVEETVAELEIA